MIQVRRSAERGHANHGWLDSHHTFSFANYFDPEHHNFRALRVINEDRVMPGKGFGLHPHDNMEILSYVISGALEHKDSMGNRAVMRQGDVQRISAGTGMAHSEYNHSAAEPVHFLQIWLFPDQRNVEPNYAEQAFAGIAPGALHPIASRSGRDGSIGIHQDAEVSVAKLEAGSEIDYPVAEGRAVWVQLIEGKLELNGETLEAGDGAAITAERELKLRAVEDAHFLLFDLA